MTVCPGCGRCSQCGQPTPPYRWVGPMQVPYTNPYQPYWSVSGLTNVSTSLGQVENK